ncbi:type II toxin-antitoxin system HipA family toxin, partial [Thiolapillus sp.]
AVEMGKQWYAGMVSGFEQELAVRNDKHRQKLADVASSPGGARPKFLYTESREDGLTHYLVKLSSKSDQYPVIRLEAACLRAAQACGIETPACRLVWYDDIGVEALSIVRFDVTPEGGRRHMVSLKTLMHAEYYYSKAYTDILYVLRKYSDDPENDSVRLFRQMLYNALIGNRDDHLRNFTLLHDDTGWRLSPGYDITPLFPLGDNEPHVLRFGLKDNTRPGANELKNLASTFGLSPARARTETERVMSSIEELRDAMALFGVPDEPAELVLGHAAAYRDRLSAKARRRPGTR